MSTFRALCLKLLQDNVGLHTVVIHQLDDDDNDDDEDDTVEERMRMHFLLLPDKTTGLSELCMYRIATSEMLVGLTSSCTAFDENTLTQEDKDSRLRLEESMKSLSKVCYNPIEHKTHFTNNQVWKQMYLDRRESSSSESERKKKKKKHENRREDRKKPKQVVSEAKLRIMKCSELRELARSYGIKMSGRKAELINRLSNLFRSMNTTETSKTDEVEEEEDVIEDIL